MCHGKVLEANIGVFDSLFYFRIKKLASYKGRTIRKVMGGGGGHFQPVRLFFKIVCCVDNLFFLNPLLEFYFFSKNCWQFFTDKFLLRHA